MTIELVTGIVSDEPWALRPLTWLGTAIDGGILAAARLVVDRALVPGPEDVARHRRALAPYLVPEIEAAPERFFAPVVVDDPVPLSSRLHSEFEGGVVMRHRFDAALEPFAGAPRMLDPIRLEHWVHRRRRPTGVILLVHGFGMGHPRFDAIALQARDWFALGLDVALYTLPSHGARKPPDAWFSGAQFASPNPAELNEAVRQAVHEVRVVLQWLRGTCGVPVGMLGLSLGGYVSAVLAGLGDDLAFVVPMTPPVCLGDLAWRIAAGTERAAAQFSRDDLRRAYRVHSPLSHPLRVPRERVLILAARGDQIVPAEHPSTLWQHWGEPDLTWFSGGHLARFGRRTIADAVTQHLVRLGLVG